MEKKVTESIQGQAYEKKVKCSRRNLTLSGGGPDEVLKIDFFSYFQGIVEQCNQVEISPRILESAGL